MLEVFNTPAPDFSCERRESSTVTPQALNLFNSKNSYDRSLALAQRAWDESSDEIAEIVICRRCDAFMNWCYVVSPSKKSLIGHWKVGVLWRRSCLLSLGQIQRCRLQRHVKQLKNFQVNASCTMKFSTRIRSSKPDLQPNDVDRHVRALGDICLVFLEHE